MENCKALSEIQIKCVIYYTQESVY